MSAFRLALSLFVYAQLLPFLFVFHILWLYATALWTGTPMAIILQDIVLIKDDICLLHPPGFFDAFSNSEDLQDHSSSFNKSSFVDGISLTASTVEDSISLTSHDFTFTIPQIMVSDTSTDQLLATGSLYDLVIFDADAMTREIELTALDSDKVYVMDAYEHSDSVTIADIIDQDLEFPFRKASNLLSSPQAAHHSDEESQELDFTEEELLTLESLSIQCPSSLPSSTSIQDITIPLLPNDTPIFSRYNIDDKVVLPVRKPSTLGFSSSPRLQRDSNSASFSISGEVNSVFNMVSATWAKTREELKRQQQKHSSLSSRLSAISNFNLFKVEQARHGPYNTWPYVRSAVEDEDAVFEAEDEEDSFESMVQSALDYFKF